MWPFFYGKGAMMRSHLSDLYYSALTWHYTLTKTNSSLPHELSSILVREALQAQLIAGLSYYYFNT